MSRYCTEANEVTCFIVNILSVANPVDDSSACNMNFLPIQSMKLLDYEDDSVNDSTRP